MFATKTAIKYAYENNIDIESIKGTGQNGRILITDVKQTRSKILPQRRLQIASSQAWKCKLCSNLLSSVFHIDHIRPWCYSRDDSDSNLQALCCECHNSKTAYENSNQAVPMDID